MMFMANNYLHDVFHRNNMLDVFGGKNETNITYGKFYD
jgi:hypothetical protein